LDDGGKGLKRGQKKKKKRQKKDKEEGLKVVAKKTRVALAPNARTLGKKPVLVRCKEGERGGGGGKGMQEAWFSPTKQQDFRKKKKPKGFFGKRGKTRVPPRP